jgi:hypothetical protein
VEGNAADAPRKPAQTAHPKAHYDAICDDHERETEAFLGMQFCLTVEVMSSSSRAVKPASH